MEAIDRRVGKLEMNRHRSAALLCSWMRRFGLEIEIADSTISLEPGFVDLENFWASPRSTVPNHHRGNPPVVRFI